MDHPNMKDSCKNSIILFEELGYSLEKEGVDAFFFKKGKLKAGVAIYQDICSIGINCVAIAIDVKLTYDELAFLEGVVESIANKLPNTEKWYLASHGFSINENHMKNKINKKFKFYYGETNQYKDLLLIMNISKRSFKIKSYDAVG